MNLVQLLAPGPVGGLERVVQGLAAGLHDRGHSVTVVAVAAAEDDMSAFLEPLITKGVEVPASVTFVLPIVTDPDMTKTLTAPGTRFTSDAPL